VSCIFKIRFVPVNAAAQRMIEDYLALTGHRSDVEGALFRPVKNNRTARLDRHLDPASVYQNIVRKYGLETGLSAEVMACVCIRCVPRQQQTLYRMMSLCT
jgi:integrase/recombinase XerD